MNDVASKRDITGDIDFDSVIVFEWCDVRACMVNERIDSKFGACVSCGKHIHR